MSKENVRVGIAVIIRNGAGNILMGLRKGSHGAETWNFPGGHIDFGEKSFEDTARREVKEETGLDLGVVNGPVFVTNDIFAKEGKHYVTLYVEAEYLGGEVKLIEPEKCEEWKWFGKEEVPEKLMLCIEDLIKGGYDLFREDGNHSRI